MGRARDLFKKIGDINETFDARMGMVQDRHGKDLTEAEEIKKRCQEYTELSRKVLMTQKTMMVWSLIQSQTSWSVKSSALWEALLQTVNGGDGIPAELFHILKGHAVKVLHSVFQQIWKAQQWPQDWKRSVFILMPKNVHTTAQFHSSHRLAK